MRPLGYCFKCVSKKNNNNMERITSQVNDNVKRVNNMNMNNELRKTINKVTTIAKYKQPKKTKT